jgi:hypothetical protein
MAGLEIIDIQQFRGGINTNSDDAPLQTAEELINFIPQPDGSLVTRPPMGPASGLSLPDFPTDAGKFFQSISFDDRIFIFTQRGIYFADNGAWQYVTPVSSPRISELKRVLEFSTEIFILSYFPFAFFGDYTGVFGVNEPVIYDSHILFSVDFKFATADELESPLLKMSFALFKSGPDQYAVRPALHTYISSLHSALDLSSKFETATVKVPRRLFTVLEHKYTYFDIATKGEKIKQVNSRPLEFDFVFTSRVVEIKLPLVINVRSIVKYSGIKSYWLVPQAIYALIATLIPDYKLSFGMVQADQSQPAKALAIGETTASDPNPQTFFSLDTFNFDRVKELIEKFFQWTGGVSKRELENLIATTDEADINAAIISLPIFRRFNEDTQPKLPRSYADYSNTGFFIRDFGTRYITTQDYLFIASSSFLYYSVNGAYDFFDPLKRITLDSQFCDIQYIQQVSVIFTENSLFRVEGEIGGAIPFLIRIFDIGIPFGSKTFQLNDRVFFAGTDGRLYAANRFNADASFGLPVQGLADDFAGQRYKPIELPEYNAFGLVFEDSFVICYRWDIGAFFSLTLPFYATPSTLVTVDDQYLFLGPDTDRLSYYKIGGTGFSVVKDTSRVSYLSPVIYPALQAERQTAQITDSDLVSIQSIDVTEKRENNFFLSLRLDTSDQPILIRYRSPEPRGRRAVGMARCREFRISITGYLDSGSLVIRRIRVYFMRHSNSGYSKNEYR